LNFNLYEVVRSHLRRVASAYGANLVFDLGVEVHEQIIDYIKKSIARGELKPGDKLPSQRKMARKVEVNPNTIQRL